MFLASEWLCHPEQCLYICTSNNHRIKISKKTMLFISKKYSCGIPCWVWFRYTRYDHCLTTSDFVLADVLVKSTWKLSIFVEKIHLYNQSIPTLFTLILLTESRPAETPSDLSVCVWGDFTDMGVCGQPIAMAGGPRYMFIILYVHSVYTWYVRYVYGHTQSPSKDKKGQEWRSQTTMLTYLSARSYPLDPHYISSKR